MLNQKKTWRCVLPNCRYFIHIGLAHILPGQQSICWGCSEQFELDERALQDDQPMCDSCRSREAGMMSTNEIGDIIEAQLALKKAGVTSVDELNPFQRSTLKMMGKLKDSAVEKLQSPKSVDDEVEVIDPDPNLD